MGYSEGVKGYCVRDAATRTFFTARDVIFDEGSSLLVDSESDDDDETSIATVPDVTVHILSHRVYLFFFLRRTHLLWGLYSYDWYHCMYLIGSTSFSLFLL
jgi:hypothetical protein